MGSVLYLRVYSAAQKFIASNIPPDKHFVSLYPICLFYLFIGFLVLYM